MKADRLELLPGVWLDARRAVWLAESRTLVVADLHLGYAWAERRKGSLVPVSGVDDLLPGLLALAQAHRPRQWVFLGDLVHGSADLPEITATLTRTVTVLATGAELVLTEGNHDRRLQRVVRETGLPLRIESHLRVGPHLLLHGDAPPAGIVERWGAESADGLLLMGHEHPAIRLDDGATTAARCPCFVTGGRRLVLPAFSPWAAGSDLRVHAPLSPLNRSGDWEAVVAILGGRLLRIPWDHLRAGRR